jgi:hypothetical protein
MTLGRRPLAVAASSSSMPAAHHFARLAVFRILELTDRTGSLLVSPSAGPFGQVPGARR